MCVQYILRSLRSFKGVPKTRKIKNKYWIVCECHFERGHVSNYSRKCRNPLTLNSNVIVFRKSHASIKRAKFHQSATKLLLHCLKSKKNETTLHSKWELENFSVLVDIFLFLFLIVYFLIIHLFIVLWFYDFLFFCPELTERRWGRTRRGTRRGTRLTGPTWSGTSTVKTSKPRSNQCNSQLKPGTVITIPPRWAPWKFY